MEKTKQTKELLETYYNGFAEKSGWEHTLSEDFQYTGGGMEDTPIVGKQAYLEIIKRFSQRFTAMHISQMIVEDDKACVIGNYDFIFPNGKKVNGNVAEIWTAKDGKLNSLRLFFDTLTFMNNLK